ncbi:hypothetical protein BFJ69_g12388 [Fusarium oxysporum]|uniref:Uncharacterized protein n=1 Tax=Fusarium oxysporum TaxID=5507 RepID=A0A420MP32_FUSOX|nr:hypothetical protein BFJ69_g12388 [Fusarium oxysporum]
MGKDGTLARRYADLMASHGHGYGSYETESEHHVKPGVCGYIDDTGLWQHIVDLTDKRALEHGGYTKIGHLVKASPAEAVWEETTSEGVTTVKVKTDLGGGSDSFKGVVKFGLESSLESGAVLLCNTAVFRQGYAHEDCFRKWAKENLATILKNCPDVKRYGFYVVRTTWTSEDVWINTWTASQKEVTIGFAVQAVNVAEISPSVEYRHGTSAGGWVHPIPKIRKNGIPEKRVLFFKGLQYKYRLAFGGITWASEMRGEEENEGEAFPVEDPNDKDTKYGVEWYRVGAKDENDD